MPSRAPGNGAARRNSARKLRSGRKAIGQTTYLRIWPTNTKWHPWTRRLARVRTRTHSRALSSPCLLHAASPRRDDAREGTGSNTPRALHVRAVRTFKISPVADAHGIVRKDETPQRRSITQRCPLVRFYEILFERFREHSTIDLPSRLTDLYTFFCYPPLSD